MPDVMGKVAIVIFAVLLSLTASEFALRAFASTQLETVTGDQFQFYRYDPVLGWANNPGAKGTFKRSEFAYPLRINSDGLRGPEVSSKKDSSIRRIAVLGDSFAWGLGVHEEDSFVIRIQNQLHNTEILNFGVSGYSPLNYLLLQDRVMSFDPDVVIIAFCLGNDFTDNVFKKKNGYYKPFARLDEGGKLVIDGYPIHNVKTFGTIQGTASSFLDQLYIYQLFKQGLIQFIDDKIGPDNFNNIDIYNRTPGSGFASAIEINRQIFSKIVEGYSQKNIQVVVAAVPTKCELGLCFKRKEYDVNGARNALLDSLKGLKIDVVDPSSEFEAGDFWVKDGHWRPSGHEKFAKAVLPVLMEALEASEEKHK